MTDEPKQQAPIERVDTFVSAGREIRMYTDTSDLVVDGVRYEGFQIFQRVVEDPSGAMRTTKFPTDFNIEADSLREAFDKYDETADNVLENIKKQMETPLVEPMPAGSEKLIKMPRSG